MTRLRFALIATTILACMFAAVSLLDSLYWFGWWITVAAVSFIAQDVIEHVSRSRREWMREYREMQISHCCGSSPLMTWLRRQTLRREVLRRGRSEVWARRESEMG